MTLLVLGYGNLDRQDDGVAWHVLSQLMQVYGLPKPTSIDVDEYFKEKDIHFLFQLQLLPELAYDLDRYDYAVLIDAHTGAITNEVNVENVIPDFQSSPLTHHLTANSLLAISKQIHQKYPQAILVSIRGYHFTFTQQLSPQTSELVPIAVAKIEDWMNNQKIA